MGHHALFIMLCELGGEVAGSKLSPFLSMASNEIPKFMKALVKDSPTESYVYKDVPVPQPGQGELLVKVKKVAICGSDITLYKWGESKNRFSYLF